MTATLPLTSRQLLPPVLTNHQQRGLDNRTDENTDGTDQASDAQCGHYGCPGGYGSGDR